MNSERRIDCQGGGGKGGHGEGQGAGRRRSRVSDLCVSAGFCANIGMCGRRGEGGGAGRAGRVCRPACVDLRVSAGCCRDIGMCGRHAAGGCATRHPTRPSRAPGTRRRNSSQGGGLRLPRRRPAGWGTAPFVEQSLDDLTTPPCDPAVLLAQLRTGRVEAPRQLPELLRPGRQRIARSPPREVKPVAGPLAVPIGRGQRRGVLLRDMPGVDERSERRRSPGGREPGGGAGAVARSTPRRTGRHARASGGRAGRRRAGSARARSGLYPADLALLRVRDPLRRGSRVPRPRTRTPSVGSPAANRPRSRAWRSQVWPSGSSTARSRPGCAPAVPASPPAGGRGRGPRAALPRCRPVDQPAQLGDQPFRSRVVRGHRAGGRGSSRARRPASRAGSSRRGRWRRRARSRRNGPWRSRRPARSHRSRPWPRSGPPRAPPRRARSARDRPRR